MYRIFAVQTNNFIFMNLIKNTQTAISTYQTAIGGELLQTDEYHKVIQYFAGIQGFSPKRKEQFVEHANLFLERLQNVEGRGKEKVWKKLNAQNVLGVLLQTFAGGLSFAAGKAEAGLGVFYSAQQGGYVLSVFVMRDYWLRKLHAANLVLDIIHVFTGDIFAYKIVKNKTEITYERTSKNAADYANLTHIVVIAKNQRTGATLATKVLEKQEIEDLRLSNATNGDSSFSMFWKKNALAMADAKAIKQAAKTLPLGEGGIYDDDLRYAVDINGFVQKEALEADVADVEVVQKEAPQTPAQVFEHFTSKGLERLQEKFILGEIPAITNEHKKNVAILALYAVRIMIEQYKAKNPTTWGADEEDFKTVRNKWLSEHLGVTYEDIKADYSVFAASKNAQLTQSSQNDNDK